jgi:hypothetical protein
MSSQDLNRKVSKQSLEKLIETLELLTYRIFM